MASKRIKTPADETFLIPRGVMQHIAGANAEELKTLIAFFAAPETTVAEAARDMGMTVAECEKAYAFWRGAGIFAESAAKPKKVAADTSSYRNYDSAEIAAALQQKGDFSLICSVAQTKLEKTLTKNDLSTLLYLYDYAAIPCQVICGVIEYCCNRGKKSMEYIYKKAIALFESGVDTYDKFEHYVAEAERAREAEAKLRRLIGVGERALTKAESAAFERWISEWNTDFSLITLAYEKTVDNTGKYSVRYMDSILKNWHEKGYSTVEEVAADQPAQGKNGQSFASDDFIEAALARGFDDGKDTK